LEGLLAGAPTGRWLDVPAGAGRWSEVLAQRGAVVQVDLVAAMLRVSGVHGPRVVARLQALPFTDRSFGGSLCMRLLHHFTAPADRIACLRELARVTARVTVVSFFHCWSVQHGRRLLRGWLGGRKSRRTAISWQRFRREAASAGLEVEAARPLRRFWSEQWLVRLRHRRR
jgi:SAM-dependent methyltransferase